MRHDRRPPEYSFLDSNWRRHIRIDVDIMTCNGTRFFTKFRYTAPVYFDLSHGWVTDCSGLPDSLFEKYPTLSHRNDIRICINDAKVVNHINQRMTKYERKEMENRADRASVTAHGSVHRRLPQVYWGTDGTEQFHVLPYTPSGT